MSKCVSWKSKQTMSTMEKLGRYLAIASERRKKEKEKK